MTTQHDPDAMTETPERQEAASNAEAAQITMIYRNWRGEVSQRTIRPVALWFGATDWHSEPGWLLNAWDCDKGERRDFALADCQFADLINAPAPAPQQGAVERLMGAADAALTEFEGEREIAVPPDIDALALCAVYMQRTADFNRSWVDGRRGPRPGDTPDYTQRRILWADLFDRMADAALAQMESNDD